MIWETPRLYLRELTEADLPKLSEMMNGQRNFYEHSFSQSELQNWLTRQQRRYRQNLGIWGIFRKDNACLIGLAGLTFQHFGKRMLLEVGYGVVSDQRGRGYAKEAAAACLHYAFSVRRDSVVHAVIAADNSPSLCIAKSIGMQREKEILHHKGRSYLLFSISPSAIVHGKEN